MSSHGRGQPADNAYWALGYIVCEKAVPAEDQSAIVRTLISDLERHRSGPEDAPKNIAVKAGENRSDMKEWSAQQWTDWAAAHGY